MRETIKDLIVLGITPAEITSVNANAIAAQAARDSINTTGKVFTTTALGIAGTTDGQSFSVLSADLQSWDIYKNAAGVATYLSSSYTKAYNDAMLIKTNDMFYVDGKPILYSVLDSNSKVLLAVKEDGTFNAKLALTGDNGLSVVRNTDSSYTVKSDPNFSDISYGASDYLWGVIDSNNRQLLTIGMDGTVTGKITVSEVISARGNRTNLSTRLAQNTNDYGLPKSYIFGEWFLRETRMRLRKRAMAESTQLVIACIGDSWTHGRTRYSEPINTTLKATYGDAGAGWTGFAWGGGGTSDVWTGGNGNVSSTDVTLTLTSGWTVAYYTTASPDIGGISTATAGSKVTTNYAGSGNISAVKLYYTAGSGVLRYRWNAGSWTTLDISSGSGTTIFSLASVPTGVWSLEIENVSGTTVIHGVDIQKSTDGVRVHKLGSTGSATSSWTSVNAANWQTAMTSLAPNLVTIMLATNDQGASMSTSTYRANIQTIITRVRTALPVADIAIIMPCENQRVSNTYAMTAYAQQAYEIAAINNCAFLDLQYVFGDTAAQYAFGSSRPWFASDLIHPDPTTGGRVITDAVYRLLTSV